MMHQPGRGLDARTQRGRLVLVLGISRLHALEARFDGLGDGLGPVQYIWLPRTRAGGFGQRKVGVDTTIRLNPFVQALLLARGYLTFLRRPGFVGVWDGVDHLKFRPAQEILHHRVHRP